MAAAHLVWFLMDVSIGCNDSLHPWTWTGKAGEVELLVFAESAEQCMKGVSLVNKSAPLQD